MNATLIEADGAALLARMRPAPDDRNLLTAAEFAAAKAEISGWPGYRPTPLRNLAGAAADLGIARLWYKDEAGRFGLGSFKALGGAYAVARIAAAAEAPLTVCCATDGNHGRAVAWGAARFGCGAVIYLHAGVSRARQQAIRAYGAEIVRIAGNYDDSVRQAAADAARNGWIVVSDTAYVGYTAIPRDVMSGYGVMVEEAWQALPDGEPPSHIFVQGGVGGLAAAAISALWHINPAAPPRFVIVEPNHAACIFESLRQDRLTAIPGELETVMAGLACGEVSLLAWPILKGHAGAAMRIDDDAAIEAMRALSRPAAGDPGIVAGESAVAGLAALRIAMAHPRMARALGLDSASRVLLFGTEGATDPALYTRLVGRAPTPA